MDLSGFLLKLQNEERNMEIDLIEKSSGQPEYSLFVVGLYMLSLLVCKPHSKVVKPIFFLDKKTGPERFKN